MGRAKRGVVSNVFRGISSADSRSIISKQLMLPHDTQLAKLPAEWQEIIKTTAEKYEPPFRRIIGLGGHNWCKQTCQDIAVQIPELKLMPKDNKRDEFYSFGDKANLTSHCWLETKDGTIIDPTVKQFMAQLDKEGDNTYKKKGVIPLLQHKEFEAEKHCWVIPKKDPRRKFYTYC